MALLGIESLVLLILLEVGLRVSASMSDAMRVLLYSPTVATRFEKVDTLPDLLNMTPRGFKPLRRGFDFVTNSRSFRTPEYTEHKGPNVFRILAIGDSFTFLCGGIPYRSHWPRLLEESLRAVSSRDVELVNLSVGAVGTRFERRLWQIEGARLDADLVILAFCIGNDFVEEQADRADDSIGARAARASYVARLVRNLLRLGFQWRSEEQGAERASPSTPTDPDRGGYVIEGYEYDPMAPTFPPGKFARIVARRMAICNRAAGDRFEMLLADVVDVLRALRDEVEAQGADFVVMLIPEEYQVDPEVRDAALRYVGRPVGDFDCALPQRALVERLDREGIRYVDLLPVFRVMAPRQRLYRLRNTHWNEAGNALATEIMADFLAQQALVPLRTAE